MHFVSLSITCTGIIAKMPIQNHVFQVTGWFRWFQQAFQADWDAQPIHGFKTISCFTLVLAPFGLPGCASPSLSLSFSLPLGLCLTPFPHAFHDLGDLQWIRMSSRTCHQGEGENDKPGMNTLLNA